MGYTTNFTGSFALSRQLTLDEKNELEGYYDYEWDDENRPFPDAGYCQWVADKSGWLIEWDGGEKFYDYTRWIEWLISFFFAPKGILLNGTVTWRGEDHSDTGKITIKDNLITIKTGKIVYS